jgi:hypothetical protein
MKPARHVTVVVSMAALGIGAFVTGCNAITGADQFVIDGRGSGGSGSGTTNPSSGNGAGQGGSAVSTGAGVGGSQPVGPVSDATGVTIREIAVYQSVKSTIFQNGKAVTPTTSLVADRPAVMRVFTDVSGLSGGHVSARLIIGSEAPIVVDVGTPKQSSDASFASTINFQIPASLMTKGMSYRVEIYEDPSTSQGANPGSHFPASGAQALTVKGSGRVKVTLIPIRYGADGSNRMPDTSAGQVQAYHDLFFAMYPATSVDVTVGQAFNWSQAVDAGGNGWDTLLSAISDLRVGSAAQTDEFYFGIFDPTPDLGSFCGGGCVAGLGYVGDPHAEYTRAAIGLGYGGDVSTQTAVHEVGHNHGRPHSPCGGAAGPDPNFPYPGGGIGTWGFVLGSNQLLDPGQYKDMMGYCGPNWISDYVYESILSFKESMQGAAMVFPPETLNQTWDRVRIGPSGATIIDPIVMPRPPVGSPKTVAVTTASGTTAVEGQFYPYDHLDGGVLFVKQGASPTLSVDLSLPVSNGTTRSFHATRPAP